jgi:hypothetical protein
VVTGDSPVQVEPKRRRRAAQNGGLFSQIGTRFTVWYRVPPPPYAMQNLENKRYILRLCARSLSLQELHAKSREHGSYGDADRPGSAILGLNVDRTIAGVRLSKTGHYPVDNAIQLRLSHPETRGQLENAARWIPFPRGDSAISTCASPRRRLPRARYC